MRIAARTSRAQGRHPRLRVSHSKFASRASSWCASLFCLIVLLLASTLASAGDTSLTDSQRTEILRTFLE